MLTNAVRWTVYYLSLWPEAIIWCFRPVVTFMDRQVKWERKNGLRP